MPRWLRTLALPVVVLSIIAAACGDDGGEAGEGDGDGGGTEECSSDIRVGMALDIGGLGDKSFNDAAYRGLDKAAKELGIGFRFVEPGDGSDRESALRQLASQGNQLVIGVGFIFSDDIRALAKEFPDTKFACIDYSANPGDPVPDNLSGLRFREHEGSFLVGAIAGLTRCVRLPGPCRPWKLRLLVDATRCFGPTSSPLRAQHMEHPGWRHCMPASTKMRSRPSASACFLTRPEPGTTNVSTDALRPFATAAAARKSSIRAFVQAPMKTLSTPISTARSAWSIVVIVPAPTTRMLPTEASGKPTGRLRSEHWSWHSLR